MKKNPREAELKKRVAKLTTKPGVYRWLDARGTVLYIGKAKNLRNRVRTYLLQDPAMGPWKLALMKQAADLEVTVTNSELEALILETNLIKQKKPKYNVLMKDDKNYVYVRISLAETFPRIELVRRPLKDKAQYFGPYLSATEIRETLGTLRRVFPYRNCKMEIECVPSPPPSPPPGGGGEKLVAHTLPPPGEGTGMGEKTPVTVTHRDRPTPCLDYHIKQCCAPCIGSVAPDEYLNIAIEGVVDFLKGKTEDAVALLKTRMIAAASDRKFEQAAKIRDALKMIERLQEKQIVSDTSGEDADIFGVAVETSRAHVVLLKERNGKVIDESSFTLLSHEQTAAEVLEQFLPQYYADAPEVPPLLILAEELEERPLLERWLTEIRGTKVMIHVPERGKKNKLLELAEENAHEKVQQYETSWEAAARNVEDALKELKDRLVLSAAPKRIEGYDISHLGGTETVGSMSVFVDGKPKNDQYRSFTLKTIAEHDVDDYRSLQEVLKRRLLHLTTDLGQEEREWKKQGITFGKVRKAEQKSILQIHKEHYQEINNQDIDFKRYLVARKDNITIIGFCRIVEHIGGYKELKSLWVHDDERGQKLGQFLVRKLLSLQKKTKKMYIAAKAALVEYYNEIGFREIQNAPNIILKKHLKAAKKKGVPPGVMMVYIFAEQKKDDVSLGARPDLLLIDGGKGQLSAVVSVLKELNLSIPIIGLAKKEEEIFIPGRSIPLSFAKDSPARFLLMRLRDEAHRFANAHRESRLKKRAVFSALDALPGVGPQTRVKLLRRFGSLEAVKAASDEELSKILSQAQLKTLRGQM